MQLYVHTLEIYVLNVEIYIYDVLESMCVSEIDLDEDYGDDDGRDFSQCSGARYSRMYVLHVSESMCV